MSFEKTRIHQFRDLKFAEDEVNLLKSHKYFKSRYNVSQGGTKENCFNGDPAFMPIELDPTERYFSSAIEGDEQEIDPEVERSKDRRISRIRCYFRKIGKTFSRSKSPSQPSSDIELRMSISQEDSRRNDKHSVSMKNKLFKKARNAFDKDQGFQLDHGNYQGRQRPSYPRSISTGDM